MVFSKLKFKSSSRAFGSFARVTGFSCRVCRSGKSGSRQHLFVTSLSRGRRLVFRARPFLRLCISPFVRELFQKQLHSFIALQSGLQFLEGYLARTVGIENS